MITLLAGPPYNKSLEEIGWLTQRQVQTLYLRHRDRDGILDIDAMRAERKALEKKEEVADPYENRRYLRRVQGWPEYLIDREVKQMRAADNG